MIWSNSNKTLLNFHQICGSFERLTKLGNCHISQSDLQINCLPPGFELFQLGGLIFAIGWLYYSHLFSCAIFKKYTEIVYFVYFVLYLILIQNVSLYHK